MLASLNIHHLRNLTESKLGPLSLHNVVYGVNGSGKTSLLEAAHILGTARSFRSGGAKSLITHGEASYVIRGERRLPGGGSVSMGVQREKVGGISLRVAGEASRSVAQLADELPLLLINADSFDLLIGEPANRRRFMDWGVFHVEHDLREHRQRFQRALTQRNHLLRRGKLERSELEVWTRDLAVHAEQVSAGRERFLDTLRAVFEPIIQELAPEIGPVDLAYRRGWDANSSYKDALHKSLASDQEQGFTQTGPQRADIRVTVGGYSAAETLSRGQQKLLVCALKLAQGQMLAGERGEVLYLIDDLPSELDAERCERVCRALAAMRVQTLITCVSRSAIPIEWLGSDTSVTMFHVKQGEVDLVSPEVDNGKTA
ncbi:DNA replication/repair protein RecF [Congregibacter brevis]|uniref:DNA replication and repair protein RecF n=1 Tax=Congregibacter brevis TaxID=3081201 RepID=A0ABZ0IJL4_9GAMM|nr:DNA replication/repair protein RecF [Congregibacter sp. IMCC45268]